MTILPSGDFRGWMMMLGGNVGEVSENLGCLHIVSLLMNRLINRFIKTDMHRFFNSISTLIKNSVCFTMT